MSSSTQSRSKQREVGECSKASAWVQQPVRVGPKSSGPRPEGPIVSCSNENYFYHQQKQVQPERFRKGNVDMTTELKKWGSLGLRKILVAQGAQRQSRSTRPSPSEKNQQIPAVTASSTQSEKQKEKQKKWICLREDDRPRFEIINETPWKEQQDSLLERHSPRNKVFNRRKFEEAIGDYGLHQVRDGRIHYETQERTKLRSSLLQVEGPKNERKKEIEARKKEDERIKAEQRKYTRSANRNKKRILAKISELNKVMELTPR